MELEMKPRVFLLGNPILTSETHYFFSSHHFDPNLRSLGRKLSVLEPFLVLAKLSRQKSSKMGQKRWNRDRNAGSQWKFSSEILQRIQRKKNFCDTTIFRDFVKFWLCSRWQCIVYISGTENKIKSWPFEIFGCLRCGNDLFFYGGSPRAKKIFASKWDEKSFFGRKWKILTLFKESWWHGCLVPEAVGT